MSDIDRPKTLEHWVHWSLLAGVATSGLLIAIGFSLDPRRSLMEPERGASSPSVLLHDALRGRGIALINLGLLVLIATPFLRVAVLGIGWAVNRDHRLAAVALVVLLLLMLSFALGVG